MPNNLPTPAIIGIFGISGTILVALISTGITLYITRARIRAQILLDLYRDFNSLEFCGARNEAHKFLQQHPDKNIHQAETLAGGHHVFAVVRFYQRLWLLINNKLIPTKFVGRLFGEVFYLWYYDHFEDRLLPLQWQIARNIESLKGWFEENCSVNETKLWTERAKRDIAKQPNMLN
ncbi:MAG: hypothetical protein ACJ76Y_09685 [Thermoanaerobaculia bacterium]